MRLATRLIACATALALCAGHARAEEITAYSALESDEIAVYLAAARQTMPDLEVHVLRLSSGDLAARLIAEAGHPRTDIIWGEALTDMLDPRIHAQLQPFNPADVAALPPRYRAADHTWFATTGYVPALCVNTQAMQAQHLPMPRSWEDLAKPVYKGQIVMPDPQSSGTGYMMVAGVLQSMGAEKAWPLLRQIAGNTAQFTKSGSMPCKLARTGEYPIGVSFAFVAMQAIKQGFPVRMVIPPLHEGYELEASALLKGAAHAADAARFLRWTASPQAAAMYRPYKSIVAIPGAGPTPAQRAAGLPENLDAQLQPMDFSASARQRKSALAQWRQLIAR